MHFLMLSYSIFVRWTTIRSMWNTIWHSLREKCPNTEFFLVRIFPHLDWIRRDTKSVQIRSFFLIGLLAPLDWILTDTKSIQMRENTGQNKLRIWTLAYLDTWYLDTFHSDQKSKFKWNAYARNTDNTVSFFWHYRSVLYRWIY